MARIPYKKSTEGYATPCPADKDARVGDAKCRQCEWWESQTEKPRYTPLTPGHAYDAGHVSCKCAENN